MCRLFGSHILSVFLIAIAANCVQATVISAFSQPPVIMLNALDTSNSGDIQFLAADDDTDDRLHVPPLYSVAVFGFEPDVVGFHSPFPCCFTHLSFALQNTILQL